MNRSNGNTPHRLELLTVSRRDGVTTLSCSGDLDLAGAPAAKRLLEAECKQRPERLVIDVSALEFIDSAGLGTLVRSDRLLASEGGRLELVGASPALRRLLEITALSHLLASPA